MEGKMTFQQFGEIAEKMKMHTSLMQQYQQMRDPSTTLAYSQKFEGRDIFAGFVRDPHLRAGFVQVLEERVLAVQRELVDLGLDIETLGDKLVDSCFQPTGDSK